MLEVKPHLPTSEHCPVSVPCPLVNGSGTPAAAIMLLSHPALPPTQMSSNSLGLLQYSQLSQAS